MNRVLVTGADGYLGSRIVASCLADHRDVIAWIHARNPVELEHRSHALKECLGGDLECAGGDLLDPDAFSTIDPLGISAIVHAAAVTRFDVDRRAARRVNVAGTSAAAALAQRCPRLERFVFLGSAFAAGLLEGSIEEGPLAPDGFANNYEWSKWKSEQVLQEDHAELPWTVLRAATVIADDESGACGQLNVVHDTLRLLYQGLLSVIPGEPSVPVCLVTADMVAQAAVRLLEGPFVGRFVNACAPVESCPTLDTLLTVAMDSFQACPEFRRRRIQRPPFCRRDAFELLVQGLRRHGGSLSEQVAGSLAPFAPQLFLRKQFIARRVSMLTGRAFPDMAALLSRLCERMLATGACGNRAGVRTIA
ncbi:MAG: SDR family oxidoreductase [Chromatiales bacterium]|jgi:nucleoside-diphosphate-sugar epimerase|nr:SDR family oxidoreductase [Chromatiales bacterium]